MKLQNRMQKTFAEYSSEVSAALKLIKNGQRMVTEGKYLKTKGEESLNNTIQELFVLSCDITPAEQHRSKHIVVPPTHEKRWSVILTTFKNNMNKYFSDQIIKNSRRIQKTKGCDAITALKIVYNQFYKIDGDYNTTFKKYMTSPRSGNPQFRIPFHTTRLPINCSDDDINLLALSHRFHPTRPMTWLMEDMQIIDWIDFGELDTSDQLSHLEHIVNEHVKMYVNAKPDSAPYNLMNAIYDVHNSKYGRY